MLQGSDAPGSNFYKYVIDASGAVVQHFGSSTRPDSRELAAAIESVLQDD
ncbi:MAG: hypothetical protein GYB33_01235 [Gammaproteobacteria bacterium]|nr:hypothetical protein [Gammaproteobacteria bacterium]